MRLIGDYIRSQKKLANYLILKDSARAKVEAKLETQKRIRSTESIVISETQILRIIVHSGNRAHSATDWIFCCEKLVCLHHTRKPEDA